MLLLRTLGRLQLVDPDASEVPLFTGPKPLSLLAYLAIEGPTDRRHLGELFFSGHGDQLDSLSTTLRRLRRVEDSIVVSAGSEVRTTARCDYVELMESLAERSHAHASEMYVGSFLKGCNLSVYGVEFEEWAYQHRIAIAEALRASLIEQAEAFGASLRLDESGSLAERAYLLPGADEPEPEMLVRLHSVLAAANHPLEADVRAEALRFGIDEMSVTADRNIARTEPTRSGNLPLPLRSFIGRDPEIIELIGMLRRSDIRLVTLQGVGGAGKSQLALEVARQLADDIRFQDGVYVVGLESVADHQLVPLVIANTLGMTLQGSASPLEQLKSFIGSKQLLLILDNFEHLVEAADVTSSMLAFCPGLKLIVTSRERLETQAEHPVSVEGLRYPGPDADLASALPYEAVHLFISRAQKYDREFTLSEHNLEAVLRICHSLSGLPLGLEMAATWTEHMSAGEIASQVERAPGELETPLRDAPDRHRSLRATLDHTWELLSPAERTLLQELTVFRGGFRHDAVRAVLDATLPGLARLVHKSLLRVTAQRYSQHPLLYQYASAQLGLEPERFAELRENHAVQYLHFLSERTHTMLGGSDVTVAVAELEEEQPNIAAAWRWAIELRRYDLLLDAAETLTHFAEVRSAQVWVMALFREAMDAITEDDAAARHVVATMAGTLPILMYRIDDNERGLQYGRKAASELLKLEPPERRPGMWAALYGTGLSSMLLGEDDLDSFEQSVELATQDLERAASAGSSPETVRRSEALLVIALIGAAMNLVLTGDLDLAQNYLDRARQHLHAGQSPYMSYYCWVQHDACLAAGRADEAERWAREGYDLAQNHRYVTQEARLALCLARLKFLAGDPDAALSHAARVRDLIVLSDDGFVRSPLETLEGWMALAAGQPEVATECFLAAIQSGAAINVRINMMEPLFGLSQIFVQAGQVPAACQIIGFLAESAHMPAVLAGPVTGTREQLTVALPDARSLLSRGGALSLMGVVELATHTARLGFQVMNRDGSSLP